MFQEPPTNPPDNPHVCHPDECQRTCDSCGLAYCVDSPEGSVQGNGYEWCEECAIKDNE